MPSNASSYRTFARDGTDPATWGGAETAMPRWQLKPALVYSELLDETPGLARLFMGTTSVIALPRNTGAQTQRSQVHRAVPGLTQKPYILFEKATAPQIAGDQPQLHPSCLALQAPMSFRKTAIGLGPDVATRRSGRDHLPNCLRPRKPGCERMIEFVTRDWAVLHCRGLPSQLCSGGPKRATATIETSSRM